MLRSLRDLWRSLRIVLRVTLDWIARPDLMLWHGWRLSLDMAWQRDHDRLAAELGARQSKVAELRQRLRAEPYLPPVEAFTVVEAGEQLAEAVAATGYSADDIAPPPPDTFVAALERLDTMVPPPRYYRPDPANTWPGPTGDGPVLLGRRGDPPPPTPNGPGMCRRPC